MLTASGGYTAIEDIDGSVVIVQGKAPMNATRTVPHHDMNAGPIA
jgi:hypothetical protein